MYKHKHKALGNYSWVIGLILLPVCILGIDLFLRTQYSILLNEADYPFVAVIVILVVIGIFAAGFSTYKKDFLPVYGIIIGIAVTAYMSFGFAKTLIEDKPIMFVEPNPYVATTELALLLIGLISLVMALRRVA